MNEESKIPPVCHNPFEMRSAGIAHDLNNVLTVVSGYAEMLMEDLSGNHPLREKAEKILSAVTRARSLTGKLFVPGILQTDEKAIVNLNEIVAETLGFLRPSLHPGINVITNFSTSKIVVFADSSELLRVFMNLAGNAIQSMGDTGGTLSIETSVVEKVAAGNDTDGRKVRSGVVIISDTGCGMDQTTLNKLFEPLFSSRSGGSGKGLGLYVAGEIIAGLGGNIDVSSREGNGSAFTVSIPLFNRG